MHNQITTDLPSTSCEVIAYTRLTQDWIKAYAATLQRIQQPKNIDVRRLDTITGQLTSLLKTPTHHATKSKGKTDVHIDAEYHRTTGEDDEVRSYGLQRISSLRRSITKKGKTCHTPD